MNLEIDSVENLDIGEKFFIGENRVDLFMRIACRLNGRPFSAVVNVETGKAKKLSYGEKNSCVRADGKLALIDIE